MPRLAATPPPVPDLAILPDTALLRLSQILRIVPMGKSSFLDKVARGLFPKPVKLGPRTSAWYVADIRKLLQTAPVATPANADKNAAKAVAKRVAKHKAQKITEAERAARKAALLGEV